MIFKVTCVDGNAYLASSQSVESLSVASNSRNVYQDGRAWLRPLSNATGQQRCMTFSQPCLGRSGETASARQVRDWLLLRFAAVAADTSFFGGRVTSFGLRLTVGFYGFAPRHKPYVSPYLLSRLFFFHREVVRLVLVFSPCPKVR